MQQIQRDLIQQIAVLGQNVLCVGIAARQQRLNLLVGGRGGGVGTVHHGAAVKIGIGDGGQRHQTELFTHAVLRDHLARKLGRTLNVIGGAGGLDAENGLLGGAAAQKRLQLDDQFFLARQELFLLGHLHGVAQRAGGVRDNGDLGNGLRVLLQRRDQCVADLVIGYNAFFHVGQDGALLFCTGDDRFKRGKQILLIDGLASLAHGAQRGLVYQICKIRADCTGSCLCDLMQVNVLSQLDVAGVDAQRLVSALQIRAVDDDTAVKASRAQKRLVQNLGTVGGGQNDDTLARVKAVNFGKQLVERLLALIVAAELAVARAADGVDLINKDDGRRDLVGLLEQAAHAACAHADEHLNKV